MRKNKSFTLIELLVVIIIVGILAGVIIISTSSTINSGNIAKGKMFSRTIENGMFFSLVSEWTFNSLTEVSIGNALPADSLIVDDQGSNNGYVYGTDKIYLKGSDDCVAGKCIYLNGTTGTITVPNSSELQAIFGSENFTLEAWVKPERFYNYEGIINKSASGYYSASNGGLFMDTSGLRFIIGTGLNSSSSAALTYKPVLEQWYHLVGTVGLVNGVSTMQLYINGSLVSQTALSLDPSSDTDALCIGGFYQGYRGFLGYIDEVKIYNKVLSSTEIKQNYLAGLNSLLANKNITKEEYVEKLTNPAF